MKKSVIMMYLTLMLLMTVTGCKKEESGQTGQDIELTQVILDEQSVEINAILNMDFPAFEDGDVKIETTQDGIVEIVDNCWYGLTYAMTLEGISAGQTDLLIEIGNYLYQTTVTVGKEAPVLLTDGDLCRDIQVDKTDATVYVDDTTVTYTVVTAPSVDCLVFEQPAPYDTINSYEELINGTASVFTLNTLTIDESALTETWKEGENQIQYQATKELQDDSLVWTVKLDLGHTAVEYLKITAYDSTNNRQQDGYVHLSISYPVFEPAAGLEEIALFWLKQNSDEPLLFTVDSKKMTETQQVIWDEYDRAGIFEEEMFMMMGITESKEGLSDALYPHIKAMPTREYYDVSFDMSPLYHGTTLEKLPPTGIVTVVTGNTPENEEIYYQFHGINRLASNYYTEDATYVFYGEFSQEIRAIMAYLYGYEIDEEVFPYAASILYRGSEVIAEIITDDMTDFEKEKAVYDWMITNYNNGLKNDVIFTSDEERYAIIKTAYGLLNGYNGDCMGWSGTFFALCSMAGLDCSTLDVAAEPGGAVDDYTADHRINLIRLEGEYYFVEVSWFYQKTSPEDGDYRYMNMTTAQAEQKYSWAAERDMGPMECSDTSFKVDPQTGELLNRRQ